MTWHPFFADNPERRRTDARGWRRFVRANAYRDVWLLIITGVSLLGIWLALQSIDRVQAGRSDAIRITCAVLTGISQAGRDVLAGPGHAPETPFARQLERLGYPPLGARRATAEKAADDYVKSINRHVIAAVGVRKARGVVLPGGQINCRRLLGISRAH